MSKPKAPQFNEREFEHGLMLLGISMQQFRAPLHMPYQQGVQALANMKEGMRERWKQLKFELHPDRGGDEEAFKLVSNVIEFIDDLALAPNQPQPRPVHHPGPSPFVNVSNVTGGATTIGFGGGMNITIIFGGRGW